VKQHSKDGFICKDYEGTVVSMALYGRKEKVPSDQYHIFYYVAAVDRISYIRSLPSNRRCAQL
jgi:hypothetical protein